jgi:hypothetical protein
MDTVNMIDTVRKDTIKKDTVRKDTIKKDTVRKEIDIILKFCGADDNLRETVLTSKQFESVFEDINNRRDFHSNKQNEFEMWDGYDEPTEIWSEKKLKILF